MIIHDMWGRGLFALRPIQYNSRTTELEVEFPPLDGVPRAQGERQRADNKDSSLLGWSTTDNQGGEYEIGHKEDGQWKDMKTGNRLTIQDRKSRHPSSPKI